MPSIKRIHAGPRFSRAVVHNGTAYFSGLTADDWNGDITAQTQEILAKADALLDDIGANRSQLLNAMIWLREIEDFAGMNSTWEEWIDEADPPARATAICSLAAPNIRVEIQFTVAVS